MFSSGFVRQLGIAMVMLAICASAHGARIGGSLASEPSEVPVIINFPAWGFSNRTKSRLDIENITLTVGADGVMELRASYHSSLRTRSGAQWLVQVTLLNEKDVAIERLEIRLSIDCNDEVQGLATTLGNSGPISVDPSEVRNAILAATSARLVECPKP